MRLTIKGMFRPDGFKLTVTESKSEIKMEIPYKVQKDLEKYNRHVIATEGDKDMLIKFSVSGIKGIISVRIEDDLSSHTRIIKFGAGYMDFTIYQSDDVINCDYIFVD